jgi:hypothetical protein
MKRFSLLATVAAVLGLGAPASFAQTTPVASTVLYEVNEALRFLKVHPKKDGKRGNGSSDPVSVARRLAKASLLGKEVHPLRPNDLFQEGAFIQAEANSNVNLNSGKGPLSGKFLLLTDTDPTRESLDTLMVTDNGPVKGELDLTTAMQGYASMSGRWSTKDKTHEGTFQGLFLIPFRVGDQYYYADLGLEGPGSNCGSSSGICPLEDDEFALGIPLTKALILFSE